VNYALYFISDGASRIPVDQMVCLDMIYVYATEVVKKNQSIERQHIIDYKNGLTSNLNKSIYL